jgi:hypothetical protein
VGRKGRRTQTHPLAMHRDPAKAHAAKAFCADKIGSKARRSLRGQGYLAGFAQAETDAMRYPEG